MVLIQMKGLLRLKCEERAEKNPARIIIRALHHPSLCSWLLQNIIFYLLWYNIIM